MDSSGHKNFGVDLVSFGILKSCDFLTKCGILTNYMIANTPPLGSSQQSEVILVWRKGSNSPSKCELKGNEFIFQELRSVWGGMSGFLKMGRDI